MEVTERGSHRHGSLRMVQNRSCESSVKCMSVCVVLCGFECCSHASEHRQRALSFSRGSLSIESWLHVCALRRRVASAPWHEATTPPSSDADTSRCHMLLAKAIDLRF